MTTHHDDAAAAAPAGSVPVGGSDGFHRLESLLDAATQQAVALLPQRATGRWVVENYRWLHKPLQRQVLPLLTIAALHGAMQNPKHEFFGNNPVKWLASVARLSLQQTNALKSPARLLFTPSEISLGPGESELSPQQRTVAQSHRQARLRDRLVELDIGLEPIAVMSRASDNLSRECKHFRLDVIHQALDAAREFTVAELKELVDAAVVEVNASSGARAQSSREPQLRFQKPDAYGYSAAYSYAPHSVQAEQRALVQDAQQQFRALYQRLGLSDPFAGMSRVGRAYASNDWLLSLGGQALAGDAVTVDSAGRVQLDWAAVASAGDAGAVGAGVGAVGGAGDTGDTRVRQSTPRASLVIYAHWRDMLAHDWRRRSARRNDGTLTTLGEAERLAPQGVDHVAVIGGPNSAVIQRLEPGAEPGSDVPGHNAPGTNMVVAESLTASTQIESRFASHMQRLLLAAVQPYCAFPDCDVPAIDCEAHHIVPFAAGGKTAVHNLALICRFHHARNDDSHSKEHQGHVAKDARGVAYWQPHGDPLPPPRYNPRNVLKNVLGDAPPGAVSETSAKSRGRRESSGRSDMSSVDDDPT